MPNSIDRSIRSAEISLQMEGLFVSDACKALYRKLLSGEISLQEYLSLVSPNEGKACYVLQNRFRYRGLLPRNNLFDQQVRC